MSLSEQKNRLLSSLYKLSVQDRQALMGLVAFAAVLLLIYGIIVPALNFQSHAKADFKSQQQLYHWLANQKAIIEKLPSQPSNSKSNSSSFLSDINHSAKALKLKLKRVQPDGDNGQRVWIENANFNKVLKWIESLNQLGLTIEELNIDRQAAGIVNLRITISR